MNHSGGGVARAAAERLGPVETSRHFSGGRLCLGDANSFWSSMLLTRGLIDRAKECDGEDQ